VVFEVVQVEQVFVQVFVQVFEVEQVFEVGNYDICVDISYIFFLWELLCG
jgi:hypothetical protein